jgi:hypothetical protein
MISMILDELKMSTSFPKYVDILSSSPLCGHFKCHPYSIPVDGIFPIEKTSLIGAPTIPSPRTPSRTSSILLSRNKKLDSMPRVVEEAAYVPQSVDFLRLCVTI